MKTTIVYHLEKSTTPTNKTFDQIISLFLECYYLESECYFVNRIVDNRYFFTYLKYLNTTLECKSNEQRNTIYIIIKDVHKMKTVAENRLTCISDEKRINIGLDVICNLRKIIELFITYLSDELEIEG